MAPAVTAAFTDELGPWFEEIPTALGVTCTKTLRFVAANRALRDLVGYSTNELASLTPRDLVVPSERDAEDPYEQLLSGRVGSVRIERRVRRKDGGVFQGRGRAWLTQSRAAAVVMLEPLSVVQSLRKGVRDQLERSELYWQKLLLSMPDAILIVAADGRVVDANPAATTLLGHEYGELVELRIESLMPERFRGAHDAHRDGYFSAPRARGMGAISGLRVLRKDGAEVPVDITLGHIRDGTSSHAIAVIRDMTTQVAAQAALEAQRTKLQRANVMAVVGRMAAGLAHDFNNVLQVVRSCTEAATSEVADDASVLVPLMEIDAATSLAQNLTREMLSLGRRSEQSAERWCDVNTIVTRGERLLRRLLGPVELVLALGPDARAVAAPMDVELVLLNLVANAHEATRAGRVTISTERLATRFGEMVALSVVDTGVGMSPETLERCREPFLTTKEAGSGIGLTSVFDFAERVGGRVEIESELGRGTSVRVLIPTMSECNT